jgi:adenylylsulfate kinase
MTPGCVYWFTGLSGAGKTTLGRLFHERLQAARPNAVFLDGDVLREVIGDDLGHSYDQRMKSAMRNARLCKLLSDQGIDVVCATISMFHECQRWNRKHIPCYREIYLRVPMQELMRRDQKQLYSRAQLGEVRHVWGVDIAIEEPENPDLIIDNDGTRSPGELVESYFEQLLSRRESK